MMRHLFEEGHVDVAIFQPTYLMQWYREGFNTTARDAVLAESTPTSSSSTRPGPVVGDAGLEEFEAQGRALGGDARGSSCTRPSGDSRTSLKTDDACFTGRPANGSA